MYKQGEIVIVPFPFSDLSSIKQRPVLILSKNADNERAEDVITCGITSNIKNSKYSVLIENKNLIEGKIPKPSRVKLDKIFTISQDIVKKKIGRISKETFEKAKLEFVKLV
ncbi:MAG: type II toxin-antitoxin system PemK/MazF family toxin [Candidatus Pacearchaeota archaeon]|nr:type II toxin-antitoxin system PemK/MazF family toxin [Candidatus Pacearchaeota archaeon]